MRLLQSPSTIAKKLKHDQITDRDHYYFLTGYLFLYGMVAQPTLLTAVLHFKTYPVHEFFSMLAFIISVWEIETCFHINKEGDRQDFLSRFTCLGFAVSIRYFAVFYLIYLAIWGTMHLPFMSESYAFLNFLTQRLLPY